MRSGKGFPTTRITGVGDKGISQLHGIGQRTNPLRTPSHEEISHAIDTDREFLSMGRSN